MSQHRSAILEKIMAALPNSSPKSGHKRTPANYTIPSLTVFAMNRFAFFLLTAACLATAPRLAAAQDGGFPVQTTPRTQFVMLNGEVVRREGESAQTTSLTQNVKLAGGVKINYKSGIVEMPADKINPKGKKITLREGDYVKADGGVVFATPTSAAAARGEASTQPNARYETYVQRGAGYADPNVQVGLLRKKIELLERKISLLSNGRPNPPDTKAVDDELARLEPQLTPAK
jgi:hypothetical protein